MQFYDALQMNPSQLKSGIQAGKSGGEKFFFSAALLVRALLIVAFAIVFIGGLSPVFGSENTPMMVVLFCILLAVRFVNFEYRIGDSLLTFAAVLLLLLFAPTLSTLVPSPVAGLIHFLALFAILFMTCQRPENGNGGLYSFAYIYLVGNPVTGAPLLRRALLTAFGYLLCASILFWKHRRKHKSVRFSRLVSQFRLSNRLSLWQIRLAAGVSLALMFGRLFQIERFMWMGFACSSLLATYPYSEKVTERFWQRLFGVAVGSGLFFLIFQLLPSELHTLIGPLGGLCLGFCSSYRFKTMWNCLGALMLGSGIYGAGGAVSLRIWDTALGVLCGFVVAYLFHRATASRIRPMAPESGAQG